RGGLMCRATPVGTMPGPADGRDRAHDRLIESEQAHANWSEEDREHLHLSDSNDRDEGIRAADDGGGSQDTRRRRDAASHPAAPSTTYGACRPVFVRFAVQGPRQSADKSPRPDES